MRDTESVQSAFGTVVLVVCAIGVIGAVVSLLLNRRTWDSYGDDHLLMESDIRPRADRWAGSGVGGAGSVAERDAEVRQMLDARNARRRRRGEPELDVEAELARLTTGSDGASAPEIDDALRAEIRELVVARNHRRARRGEPALDVEAEVAREIAALGGL